MDGLNLVVFVGEPEFIIYTENIHIESYIYYIFAAYTYIYILILCNIMHMLYMYVTRTCTIISTVHYVIYIYTHMVRTYNCDHVCIYIYIPIQHRQKQEPGQ